MPNDCFGIASVVGILTITHMMLFHVLSIVTVVAALYLQRHPDWTPKDVWTAIESHALRDLVSNVPPSTSNLILSAGDLLF